MKKAVIFDFDGVIHDTFEFHRNKIMQFTGKDLSPEDYRKFHEGNIFKTCTIDADWDSYRDYVYHDICRLKIKEETKKAILSLHDRYALFIISSGDEKNISEYLANNGLDNIFKEILGYTTCRSKVEKFKQLLERYRYSADECIFITDTLGDILEANKAGIETIAVDFGFHEKKTLEKGKPAKIISSLSEVMMILQGI